MKTNLYVVGFLFSADLRRVALIRKTKPRWQAGKLNGIGGKIEPGEDAYSAMIREFREETGAATVFEQWTRFCEMGGGNDDGQPFTVHFFAGRGDLSLLGSPEEERVEIRRVTSFRHTDTYVVDNVRWLIPLAIDFLENGRPQFANVVYPS